MEGGSCLRVYFVYFGESECHVTLDLPCQVKRASMMILTPDLTQIGLFTMQICVIDDIIYWPLGWGQTPPEGPGGQNNLALVLATYPDQKGQQTKTIKPSYCILLFVYVRRKKEVNVIKSGWPGDDLCTVPASACRQLALILGHHTQKQQQNKRILEKEHFLSGF